MTEKQPSAEAIALVMRIKGIYRHGHEHDEADALALDAFAARSRREAITECADVCRSLGQYSGRNVQPAIEQIADQIAALNEAVFSALRPRSEAAKPTHNYAHRDKTEEWDMTHPPGD